MPRKFQYLLVALLTLAGLSCAAIPSASASTPSGGHVTITGGKGTKSNPYTFKVTKNHNYMVVGQRTTYLMTRGGYHFVATVQLLMSNATTEHWDGDHSVTNLYVRWRYHCTAESYDVIAACQHVSFYDHQTFGSNEHVGDYYSCTQSSTHYCAMMNTWSRMYHITYTVDGGLWASDYPFSVWSGSLWYLSVKTGGQWIHRSDITARTAWYKATLHT